MADDFSPALSGPEGLPDYSLAPVLGSPAARGRRPWWNNLKGPIAVLLADLGATTPRVRRRAAEALARLGDRRAAPALAQGMRDRAWEVRLACLEALLQLSTDGLAAVLARATRDGNPRIRMAAAAALPNFGDAHGLQALEALEAYLDACGQEADCLSVSLRLSELRARLGSA